MVKPPSPIPGTSRIVWPKGGHAAADSPLPAPRPAATVSAQQAQTSPFCSASSARQSPDPVCFDPLCWPTLQLTLQPAPPTLQSRAQCPGPYSPPRMSFTRTPPPPPPQHTHVFATQCRPPSLLMWLSLRRGWGSRGARAVIKNNLYPEVGCPLKRAQENTVNTCCHLCLQPGPLIQGKAAVNWQAAVGGQRMGGVRVMCLCLCMLG